MTPLQIALKAAQTGGDIAASYFDKGIEARGKSTDGQVKNHELITDADLESEEAIVKVIRAAFPKHQILAEEQHTADLDSTNLWIVDPIDGTNNFAHAIPHWAVSIAYYENSQPVCGVIFNPVRDDLFVAEKGGGASYNGNPIRVSNAMSLQEVLIGVGFYYDRGKMMEATLEAMGNLFRAQVHGMRRLGTASLDLCSVALGWYGGYFEYELSPWDFAAGRLIVEEAGGKFTDCHGNVPAIGKSSVLASNGHVHTQIHDIVGPLIPDGM